MLIVVEIKFSSNRFRLSISVCSWLTISSFLFISDNHSRGEGVSLATKFKSSSNKLIVIISLKLNDNILTSLSKLTKVDT